MWKSISDLFAGAAPLLSWLGFLLGLLVYFQNRKTAKRTAQIAEENQAIARRAQDINLMDPRVEIRNAFTAIMDEFPRFAYGLGAQDIAVARDAFRNADVYCGEEIHAFLTQLIDKVHQYFRECNVDTIGDRLFMNEAEIQEHETRVQALRESIIASRDQGNTLFNRLMQVSHQ
ncbi:hypothetical protein P9430_08600 [Citrobacter freundii]